MGRLSPRPPLPKSATAAEMRADLAAYRRDIRRTTILHLAALTLGVPGILMVLIVAVTR